MYSEYVKNYDTGTTLIANWCTKCAKFKVIIDELQSLPECGHLALQHHMLEPIQRVPRYELLLKGMLLLLYPLFSSPGVLLESCVICSRTINQGMFCNCWG
jgi:hypothetical protein